LEAKKKAAAQKTPPGLLHGAADFCTSWPAGSADGLLFLPGLAGVGGDPGFFGGARKLSVQSVGEFDSNNVIFESFAVRYWSYLCPVFSRVGRVE
jgi:hypothetical protein